MTASSKPATHFWILSDLHLESVPHPDAFDPPRPDFDVLVCAGDVWQADTDRGFAVLRSLAGDRPVIAVLGNHEHWRSVPHETVERARRDATRHEVVLLEGDEATVEGVRFIGATLWSDYDQAGSNAVPTQATGESILFGNADSDSLHPLTIADTIDMHRTARSRLTELIEAHDDPSVPLVVVTHHAPHPHCLPERYLGTWAAGNCTSDLSDLTDTGRIALWVHGHIHLNVDLVRPGGTRIVCNPAGTQFSNTKFDEGLVIEV